MYHQWFQWYTAGGYSNSQNPYTNPYASSAPSTTPPPQGATQAEYQWFYQYYRWDQWWQWEFMGGGSQNPENPYTNPYTTN
jgi:hypothetical protein